MNKVLALSLTVGLIVVPAYVRAADMGVPVKEQAAAAVSEQAAAPVQEQAATAVKEAAAVAVPVEVGNKVCPVSGEVVGKMGAPFKKEYMGKIYNLCCPMCVKDFDKDPAKYTKIAEDEVKSATEMTK